MTPSERKEAMNEVNVLSVLRYVLTTIQHHANAPLTLSA
jgi:hypothetical protein